MEVETTIESFSKQRDNKNVIGQFLLGNTVGEGTFGKVKIGTHMVTGEKVAVKILEKIRILDESDKIRIDREIKILKSLMHHNIIQIYSVIENPTTIFLIMEYASGGELYDYICLKKRLTDFEACKFFHQITNGVEYIHKVGVVHRDLKPENLLLDHKNNIKIVDFGLSNIYSNGLNFKTPCGSPCYAAPEMIEGKIYNGMSADIWSIGIILYAMLCGFLPFDDPDNDTLYKKIIEGKFILPDFLSDNAQDLLANILNTDPEKRYTLKQIRSHPWFNRIPVIINEGLLINVINMPVDEKLLDRMIEFGYDNDETREFIQNNRHNNATTTYYLLMKNQFKNGISSVSDMVSIEFLRHIRNPHNLKFGSTRPNGLVDSNITYTHILENKSNFDSNICEDNDIMPTEPDYFHDDTIDIYEKPPVIETNQETDHTDPMKVTVYENNFHTEANIKSIMETIEEKESNTKSDIIIPSTIERITREDEKPSETTTERLSPVIIPVKNPYRSTTIQNTNGKNVKTLTMTKKKANNKMHIPNIPIGSKNIKKKLEEEYEKYVKNQPTDRLPNKFKKGFFNTSAIFEKSSNMRSKSIADKYKSESSKYGSNNGNKTPSSSKRDNHQSPSHSEVKKNLMTNIPPHPKASLISRPPLNNKMVSKMKKALNRSCPDIIDKISDSNVIFTIKEEKEGKKNNIKLAYKKVNDKVRGLVQLNLHDKFGNHSPDTNSAVKLVNRYQSSDRTKLRIASGSKERYDYYSNYFTGKSKIDDDSFSTKKSTKSRLSVPKKENYKFPPSSDRKFETRKIPTATATENKETNNKIKGGNSVQKNKLREINKAITSRKKDTSISRLEKTKGENDVSICTKLGTDDNEVITVAAMSTRSTNSKTSINSIQTSGSKTRVDSTKKVYSSVITKNVTYAKHANTNIKTIKLVDPGLPTAKQSTGSVNRSSSIIGKSSTRASSISMQAKNSDEVVVNSNGYDISHITQEKLMDDILKVVLSLKIKSKPVSGNKYKYSCNISKLSFDAEIVKDTKENKIFAKFKMNEGSSSEFKNICNKILSFVKI